MIIESFRPGVVDRLGIGYADVAARNPRIVYCSTTGFGQDGPHAQWAGHDLDYLAVGGFLDCTGRGADGSPPLPGATVADSAGGGMHAVIAILAALVRRAAPATAPTSTCRSPTACSRSWRSPSTSTSRPAWCPGPATGSSPAATPATTPIPPRDGRWLAVAAIEPRFWANLCARARPRPLDRRTRTTTRSQDAIRADMRAAFAHAATRDEWVAELAPADTCVAPVLSVAELVDDAQFVARGAFVEATHPEHGTFRQVAPTLAGTVRATDPTRCATPPSPTPTSCSQRRASPPTSRRAPRGTE